MPTNGTQKTFEIGLAMAGAVSAGAYSAGVLDFLIEALDQWEQARGTPGIPDHRVILKVVSGASAGAITGAIGTIALAGGLRPQAIEAPGLTVRTVLPNLYKAWVVQPRMVAASGPDLLSLDDLNGANTPPAVHSLLNAGLLDGIRDAAMVLPERGKPLPYICSDLHVYFTVTNMRGIPYSESFEGGAYGMQTHGDRMHYVISGVGSADSPSPWASMDPGIRLDAAGLFNTGKADWKMFGMSAVASGAFPVGLAPRVIHATTDSYSGRFLPVDLEAHEPAHPASNSPCDDLLPISPQWPKPWYGGQNRDFEFLSVDGGVINNQPFEYARFSLMKNPPDPNERDGSKADRAIIMIDPFPAPPSFLMDGKPAADIVSVLSALLPALINQARFKPSELLDAANESVFSRYLIAPHRQLPGKPAEEPNAIACGLLSGFGGFLDEAFRRHDFQLGRRNCQRFLQQVFALHPDNPIVTSAEAENFATTPDQPGQPICRCIIPLVGSAQREVVLPPWPRIAQADFDTLQSRIEKRLNAVLPILIERQTTNKFLRCALKFASAVSKARILDYARYRILADLVRRDQIAGWALPCPLETTDCRAVLSELLNPSFDLRSVEGIASSTGLDAQRVEAILTSLAETTGAPFSVWQTTYDAKPAYALQMRKPPIWRRAPIVGWAADMFDQPIVN